LRPNPKFMIDSVSNKHDSPDEVVHCEITGVSFDGYLKYKTYEVVLSVSGSRQRHSGGFVHGPGHHIGAVAALAFDHAKRPHPILKSGDTRLARAERSEPYVQDGMVAGRMDKEGAHSSKIALAEIAEEVGGEVVGDTFRELGSLSPSMPFESTEADHYYLAAVVITGKPSGDGGRMEVEDLIGPKFLSPDEALRSMDNGEVSEGGRSRTMFCRGFDSIGYIHQLGIYVHDHPALKSRFETLGLGEPVDIRDQLASSRIPEEAPPNGSLESQINHVVPVRRDEVPLTELARLIDTESKHAVKTEDRTTELDGTFRSQYLQLDYDRVKLADYYLDPDKGPMIRMQSVARPALAFAPDSLKVVTRDIQDLPISRDKTPQEQLPVGVRALGKPTGASPGQSDLYYHFYVRETKPTPDGYVTLGEAIKMCRTGDADSHTEAFCGRLADDLGWIPNLRLYLDDAKQLTL
jgi:hypothetical protein